MSGSQLVAVAIALAATASAFANETEEKRLRTDVRAAQEALAAEPDDRALQTALAKAWYYLAVEDRGRALGEAEKLFADLSAGDPGDAVARAYLGSIRLLRSDRTWKLWEKEKLARGGLRLLDDAVAAAPDSQEVRFVRAMTTFNLPEWFERGEETAADFAWLAERIGEADADAELPPRVAATALFHHGLLEARAGRQPAADAAWRRAQEIAPESHAGRDAAARLANED